MITENTEYSVQTLETALDRLPRLVALLRERLLQTEPPPLTGENRDYLLAGWSDSPPTPGEAILAVDIVAEEASGAAAKAWLSDYWREAAHAEMVAAAMMGAGDDAPPSRPMTVKPLAQGRFIELCGQEIGPFPRVHEEIARKRQRTKPGSVP